MENETTGTNDIGEEQVPDREPEESPTPKSKRRRPKAATPKKRTWKMVVLFRHGIAEDVTPEKTDEERSLTTSGHDRTKRAARGLSSIVSKVDTLYSSPLLRALQTALWLTKAFKGKVKVQTSDALRPDASVEDLRKLIDETDGASIVVVGHEPNLSLFLASLLGVDAISVRLRRAGCIGIRIDEEGRGTLEWMLTPGTLRNL